MDDPRRILHVDDDEDILQIVQLSLGLLGGFTLLQCASGAEAIAKAEDFAPDLIIMDYMMPDMNGPAALVELRKTASLSQVPAMFMTAKNLSVDVDAAAGAEVIGSIAKPFDAMELPNQVLDLWRRNVANQGTR
jgi:CheY-like chemotaxis protein